MDLPVTPHWPDSAVTFLLVGGLDYFRGSRSPEAYLADVLSHVPKGNRKTAVLFVEEMQHMPQAPLLGAFLALAVATLLEWRSAESPPTGKLQQILLALSRGNWKGQLWYTAAPGQWQDAAVGPSRADAGRALLSAATKGGA